MKTLHGMAFAVLSSLLGLVAAATLHYAHPAPPVLALTAERERLKEELLRMADTPPMVSVHRQWTTLRDYIDIYRNLSLTATDDGEAGLSQSDAASPYFYWRGVLTGPAKDLLLVSRSLQTMAAIRFERLSIEQGQASLFLSLTGGPA